MISWSPAWWIPESQRRSRQPPRRRRRHRRPKETVPTLRSAGKVKRRARGTPFTAAWDVLAGPRRRLALAPASRSLGASAADASPRRWPGAPPRPVPPAGPPPSPCAGDHRGDAPGGTAETPPCPPGRPPCRPSAGTLSGTCRTPPPPPGLTADTGPQTLIGPNTPDQGPGPGVGGSRF